MFLQCLAGLGACGIADSGQVILVQAGLLGQHLAHAPFLHLPGNAGGDGH
ncbi:hypothetical protein HKK57_25030 [Pseudomonas sp. ADAK21]|nr:hypothetical protein HKK57_25030 [Pseudomonas sp. ADAK21]QJI23456.1 hypothetical protein HKK56_08060 [Pseudomonas sp. ADAK20]